MFRIRNYLRSALIVGTLPNNIQNGQVEDAVPLMANLNWIVNQVNANAQAIGLAALLASANTFTQVQSGVAATNAANFPIASQVQNNVFNTLTSTLGTNTITGRNATLPLSAYAVGQIFSFIPSQKNTASATYAIDGLGSAVFNYQSQQLIGGELGSGAAHFVVRSTGGMPVLDLLNPAVMKLQGFANSLVVDVALNNTANFFDGPTVSQGSTGTWFVSGTVTMNNPTGAATYVAKLWDGTNIIASAQHTLVNAGQSICIALSGFLASPAGNIRISVRDANQTTGSILANASGLGNNSSTITAIRVA